MISLKVQLEDRDKTIELLKKNVEKLRDTRQQDAKQHQKEQKRALADQKRQYEGTVKRHLSFVDRLLGDKDQLNKDCEGLTQRIKLLEREYKLKSEKLQEEHLRILKQNREKWAAEEKTRREQWIDLKTKSIKSITIKGLEPEIQRLIDKGKRDMAALEQRRVDDLSAQKKQLTLERQEEVAVQKEALLLEKQEAMERLREESSRRQRVQMDRYETEIQEERQRLKAEAEERLEAVKREHRETRDRWEDSNEALKRTCAEQVRFEEQKFAEQLEGERRRLQIQLKNQSEKDDIERQQWQQRMLEKFHSQMEGKTALYRKKLDEQQREEIEEIIERITKQTDSKLETMKTHHSDALKRLLEKHRKELVGARKETSEWIEKFMKHSKQYDVLKEEIEQARPRLFKAELTATERANELRSIKAELKLSQDSLQTLEGAVAAKVEAGKALLQGRLTKLEGCGR